MTWFRVGGMLTERNEQCESLSVSFHSDKRLVDDGISESRVRSDVECKKHDPREFICGWGAAFINITVTYPVYKVIFRQMLHGVNTSNALHQIKGEGILFLYRGMFPPLCQKTASLSLMFGVYDECRRPLLQHKCHPLVAKSVAAIVAGSVEAILMPFERIQTLLQDNNYHSTFKNSGHAFRVIGAEYGFREYYRGLTPILLRNGPSNVLFFVLRDEIKNKFSNGQTWYGEFFKEFCAGACIGAFISTLFYPLNVLKVRMQSQLGGPFENSWLVFINLYREKGLKSMYHGVHLNYTRAFLSWGVINVSYEFLKKLMY